MGRCARVGVCETKTMEDRGFTKRQTPVPSACPHASTHARVHARTHLARPRARAEARGVPGVPAPVPPNQQPAIGVLGDGVGAAREGVEEAVKVAEARLEGAARAPLQLRVDLALVPPDEGLEPPAVELGRRGGGGRREVEPAAVAVRAGGLVLDLCGGGGQKEAGTLSEVTRRLRKSMHSTAQHSTRTRARTMMARRQH